MSYFFCKFRNFIILGLNVKEVIVSGSLLGGVCFLLFKVLGLWSFVYKC